MSKSLAVRYRPQTFEDCTEQDSIIKILSKQLETMDIQHCYLFCGPSGCGKTTIARIFANQINKGSGNPIEIDAASNSGVDNVRALIKGAQERAIDGDYKVYIIDEVHGLTSAAWQSLLKPIEEPPEFTIFIFCTTDPQKIPVTILNRVQRFNFSRISSQGIQKRLEFVCNKESLSNYTEAVEYISKISEGCMRDALTMLDKCVDYSTDLSIQNVLTALGNYSYQVFFNLINALIDGNESEVLKIVSQHYEKGNDLKIFVDQFLTFCLDVTKYCLFKSCDLIRIPRSLEGELQNATNFQEPQKYYMYVVDKLLSLKNMIKTDPNCRSTVEVCMLNVARGLL